MDVKLKGFFPFIHLQQDTWLDVSSHNVGLPALSIKQPDCHGHLTKMGHRHKTWKRRYCVLKDACLYYYMDVSSSTAQGPYVVVCREIFEHYQKRKTFVYNLQYSAFKAYKGSELFIFSDKISVPKCSSIPYVDVALAS